MDKKRFVVIEEPDKALLVLPSIWVNDDRTIKNYMFPKNKTTPEDLLSLFTTVPKDQSRPDIKWKKYKYSIICSEHDDFDEANTALSSLENERSSAAAMMSSAEKSMTSSDKGKKSADVSLFDPMPPSKNDFVRTSTSSDQFSTIIEHLIDIKNGQNEMSKRMHNLEENDRIIKQKLERLTAIKQLCEASLGCFEVNNSPDNTPTKMYRKSANGTPQKTTLEKIQKTPILSPSKKYMPWRVKLGFTIRNEEGVQEVDGKLENDKQYLSAFRSFLKFAGNRGSDANTKMKLILPEIFEPEIVSQYNTNGQHNKKNITTTLIMKEIFDAIETQDLKASKKDISVALSKAMKRFAGAHRSAEEKERRRVAQQSEQDV
ncbi:uncharacterized protein LOC135840511 isoform X2 [Planococcus citri]|uniref:uncharacterized protein LOC135840450 isoform X2 n=1 Tax=Planococcus citri TaxID=170843 RepID=UPI0031F8287F